LSSPPMKTSTRFALPALVLLFAAFTSPAHAQWRTPTVSLSANPASVSAGGSSTLTWSSSRAASCTASGGWSGDKPTSGSQGTGALSTSPTYSLTCVGAGGSRQANVTVAVSDTPATPAPSVSLSASPTSVSSGGSSTLTWSSTDATSCTASGGWSGSKAT